MGGDDCGTPDEGGGKRLACVGVERVRRLVEEKKIRFAQPRGGERHALALAKGERTELDAGQAFDVETRGSSPAHPLERGNGR